MSHTNPQAQSSIRVGAIGLDSSHTFEFSRRIQKMHAEAATPCHVTCCWDIPVDKDAAAPLRELGIRFTSTLEELLSSVDAVMVLTVDGHRHFDLAINGLTRGLPTFIDKPLTCSAAQAAALLEFTRAHNARCYSASALRFIDRVPDFSIDSLGRLISVQASGPYQEIEQMRGLWYYACHTFELVDSIWPRAGGVRRIRARVTDAGHHIDLEYRDGRSAVIGLDRAGTAPFTAILRGESSSIAFEASLLSSYDRLVASICRFFEGEDHAFPLENTAEIVSLIECSHKSLSRQGDWIALHEPSTLPSQNEAVSTHKNVS